MDTQEMLMREYTFLREENSKMVEMQNSLLTFTATATITVLSFAYTQKNILPFLFLMPLCLIVPVAMKSVFYYDRRAKAVAYMIVFLESELPGVNWETRNAAITGEKKGVMMRLFAGIIWMIKSAAYLSLSCVCYALFVIYYIKQNGLSKETGWHLIWPFLLVLFLVYLTGRMLSYDKNKETWIGKWKEKKIETGSQTEASAAGAGSAR